MNTILSKKQRNGSVEFFRCLLMFLIVFWHCYDCGPFGRGADPAMWSAFFALTFWHVDGFIAISGWYGIRFAWSKVIRLWGLMAFAALSSILLSCATRMPMRKEMFNISGGWFGGSYMLLMFMAPLIESALICGMKLSRKHLLYIWSVFAVGMTLAWVPFFSRFLGVHPAGGGGWSFLTLMYVYVTARVLKMVGIKYSRKLLVGAILFLVGSQLILGGCAMILRHLTGQRIWGFVWGAFSTYDAPHMWMFAIVLLITFEQGIKVPNWLSRLSCFLAPSMFSVYLIHHNTYFARYLYINPEIWMEEHWEIHNFINILLAAVFCFAVCVLLDILRRVFLHPFMPFILRQLVMIDKKWDDITKA